MTRRTGRAGFRCRINMAAGEIVKVNGIYPFYKNFGRRKVPQSIFGKNRGFGQNFCPFSESRNYDILLLPENPVQ